MKQGELPKVYNTAILPAIEYCSEIYDSLIPGYLSDQLEAVQKQAMKIVFGWGLDYIGLIESGRVKSLKQRRTEACLRFANKTLFNPRFGPIWFPLNSVDRTVRASTRKRFKEEQYKTERSKNNPVQHMIRLLN